MYPLTTLGKFMNAAMALLGIGLLALPAGIISSGMVEELRNNKEKIKCPKCEEEKLYYFTGSYPS